MDSKFFLSLSAGYNESVSPDEIAVFVRTYDIDANNIPKEIEIPIEKNILLHLKLSVSKGKDKIFVYSKKYIVVLGKLEMIYNELNLARSAIAGFSEEFNNTLFEG